MAFAELQPLWKEAILAAAAPLEAMQKQSLDRRHAMIEEAKVLGAAPMLRVDAVKALQQRWQAEAQAIPLDRKHEQKLWDAFRKPIDEAFNRKGEEREKAAAALSDRDRVVLEASKALEAANATGDAQKIKSAMAALDAALHGQAQAAAAVAAAGPALVDTGSEAPAPDAQATTAAQAASGEPDAQAPAAAEPAPPPKPSPKPVIAMRGDDRPGMKKAEPMPAGRGGKFGDRKGAPGRFGERRDDRGDGRFGGGRFGDRPAMEDRGPRLGDVAFRAQREALEHAQSTLKKLAAQAHGEALTQLMTAWEHRSADQVPSQQELGKAVPPAVRGGWVQAIGAAPSGDPSEAMLRLEIAAEAPTPAEHLNARRQLQLHLLTRRNDPAPAQTWGQDTAKVLAAAYEPALARRLQGVLKSLMR
jgi:ATP-dependent RNA helicase SUPV3L1/SUV3